MVRLFALGIIWLAVVHEGFRKIVYWLLGIGAGLFTVAIGLSLAGVIR